MAMSSDPPAEDIWSGIKQTMKILGIIAASFLAIIAIAVLAYKLAYPTYTYRYKMTVEIEVDGQVRSGASVIEGRLVRQPSIVVPVPRVLRKFSGEAVFVELGNGRHVIAALASAGGFEHDFAKNIVPAHFGLSGNDHDLVKYPKLQGRWQLGSGTRPGLPTFVTFTDSKDPTTAVVVEPQDFEKIFGPGVRPPVIMMR